jgi:hypothetical protein
MVRRQTRNWNRHRYGAHTVCVARGHGICSARDFTKRGCQYQHEGGSEAHPNGWMTRDPSSSDWILWDVTRQRMMRLNDEAPKSEPWKVSNESLAEFLSLAEGYNKWLEGLGKPTKDTST